MYKIGIDVGGTNTDAVLTDIENNIISKVKSTTTSDIMSGIEAVLEHLITESKIDAKEVKYVMLGTTQCTNAIVERKNLAQVNVIRIAGYATRGVLPGDDWPEDIKNVVINKSYLIDGGYEFDGSKMGELDLGEVDKIISESDIHNYAISCVNSPIDSDHELQVRDYILSKVPEAKVSVSHEIGSFNLLERENATILNVALSKVIVNVVEGFKKALSKYDLQNSKFYLSQNDGTIMDVDSVLQLPILTISSGPTNSIRGAVKLEQLDNAVIVDVGGTTSDIGVLQNKLARESHGTTKIGGVNTNFRMPDMISLALGGGTIVTITDDQIEVGPKSVGHNLKTEALVFGGNTLTLTDIAVKLKRVDIGDSSLVEHLDINICQKVDEIVNKKILHAIELLKLSDQSVNVIFVGGGSIIINKDIFKKDIVYLPDNYEVANALGASIAQISGYHEDVYLLESNDPDEYIKIAQQKAIENAIKNGAVEESIIVSEFEQNPVNYHPKNAYIYKVKTVGDLNFKND